MNSLSQYAACLWPWFVRCSPRSFKFSLRPAPSLVGFSVVFIFPVLSPWLVNRFAPCCALIFLKNQNQLFPAFLRVAFSVSWLSHCFSIPFVSCLHSLHITLDRNNEHLQDRVVEKWDRTCKAVLEVREKNSIVPALGPKSGSEDNKLEPEKGSTHINIDDSFMTKKTETERKWVKFGLHPIYDPINHRIMLVSSNRW